MKNKHVKSFEELNENENLNKTKKEKCWVIRNSEGNVMWVHKKMKDDQLKDYRKKGLYVEEHMLLD